MKAFLQRKNEVRVIRNPYENLHSLTASLRSMIQGKAFELNTRYTCTMRDHPDSCNEQNLGKSGVLPMGAIVLYFLEQLCNSHP